MYLIFFRSSFPAFSLGLNALMILWKFSDLSDSDGADELGCFFGFEYPDRCKWLVFTILIDKGSWLPHREL